MFTFQFLQLQAQNFLLHVCQRCTYSSINCRAPSRCFRLVKILPVFYQHSSEVFTDSSAVLLRKLHDLLKSDFLKQLMFMLISGFVTNLLNICGRRRIKRRERVVRMRIGRNWVIFYKYFRVLGPIYTKRQRHRCDDASNTVFIENSEVIPEWDCNPFSSDSCF